MSLPSSERPSPPRRRCQRRRDALSGENMLANLKIGTRLTLLVGGLGLLMLLVAGLGLRSLGQSHQRLTESLAHAQDITQSVDAARSAQVDFKKQVQEWKNILLRGQDPEQFARYVKSFDTHEAEVQADL